MRAVFFNDEHAIVLRNIEEDVPIYVVAQIATLGVVAQFAIALGRLAYVNLLKRAQLREARGTGCDSVR